MTGLRIMTYNLERGRPGRAGLDAVFAVVDEAAPDIVALQEIEADELESLAASLGMRAYAVAGTGGNAYLSYYPLHHLQSFSLGDAGRCLRAEIDIENKRLHLYNVRLDGGRRHGEQIATLLGEDLLGDSRRGVPALILGDFGDHHCGGINWELIMALRRVSKPFVHGTYPAAFPLFTRDRGYLQGGLRVLDATVVRSRAARLASNHLPFLMTVQIRDPRRYLRVDTPLPAGKMEIAPG